MVCLLGDRLGDRGVFTSNQIEIALFDILLTILARITIIITLSV